MPTGTAEFGPTNGSNISFSTNTVIGRWRFDDFNFDPQPYTFTNGQVLTFNGEGIEVVLGVSTVAITNNNTIQFVNASSAGGASTTITNNGTLTFSNTSSGGTAQLINNAGGIVDISQLTAATLTAGSIEGAGTFRLGSKSFQAIFANIWTHSSLRSPLNA